LKRIDLSENKISFNQEQVNGLDDLDNLEVLILRKNGIKALFTGVFTELKKLNILDLGS
jgi:hypothetical protein